MTLRALLLFSELVPLRVIVLPRVPDPIQQTQASDPVTEPNEPVQHRRVPTHRSQAHFLECFFLSTIQPHLARLPSLILEIK